LDALGGTVLTARPGTALTAEEVAAQVTRNGLATTEDVLAVLVGGVRGLFDHHRIVAGLARLLAEALGHPDPTAVYVAGLVHDMGKLPLLQITEQPRVLTSDERRLVELHAVLGARMAEDYGLPPEIVRAVRHHHERWDGRGYPDGLRGEEIPLASRILAVADAVASMVERRPYRLDGEPAGYVVRELSEHAGSQFDPVVAEVAAWLARELVVHRIVLEAPWDGMLTLWPPGSASRRRG